LGTAEHICAKFTERTCLVSCLDEFECQGQRSRSPGTKNALSGADTRDSIRMVLVYARCKQGAAAAAMENTIQSMPGVISGVGCGVVFGKTSLL